MELCMNISQDIHKTPLHVNQDFPKKQNQQYRKLLKLEIEHRCRADAWQSQKQRAPKASHMKELFQPRRTPHS